MAGDSPGPAIAGEAACRARGLCTSPYKKGNRIPCEGKSMKGRIMGVSGPTVRTDVRGLKLYERVYVGDDMLTGEVVRIEKDNAILQVYEDTRGLAAGERIEGTG